METFNKFIYKIKHLEFDLTRSDSSVKTDSMLNSIQSFLFNLKLEGIDVKLLEGEDKESFDMIMEYLKTIYLNMFEQGQLENSIKYTDVCLHLSQWFKEYGSMEIDTKVEMTWIKETTDIERIIKNKKIHTGEK